MDDVDARPLNWRFVIPFEPEQLLVLGSGGVIDSPTLEPSRGPSGLDAALRDRKYDAIVASDLDGWARIDGARPQDLLHRLARATLPEGWIFVAFPNALFPRHPGARGSMTLARCRRILRSEGYGGLETYVLLPDEQAPAYLVSAADRFALDHFLRNLFLPYSPGTDRKSRWERRLLAMMHRVALRMPHRMRVLLSPGFGIVARMGAT